MKTFTLTAVLLCFGPVQKIGQGNDSPPPNDFESRIRRYREQAETIGQTLRESGAGEKQGPLRQRLVELLKETRDLCQKKCDELKARYTAFPKFIDRQASPEQYAERRKAELAYIRAQLELAECSYHEAQAAESGSTRQANLLAGAAEEYGKIHQRYRSMVAGLIARLWQSRCYLARGDIRTTLGIVNEMLTHPGRSPMLQQLQDQARGIRFQCLNDPHRRDFQLVITEARTWVMGVDEERQGSPAGQGIRWELARALEQEAKRDSTDASERSRMLTESLTIVRSLTKVKGPYQKSARKKVRELEDLLTP